MTFTYLSILLLGLAILYQDIKHREVSIIFFLLLAVAGIAITLLQTGSAGLLFTNAASIY